MKRWGWHPPAVLALWVLLLMLGAWLLLGMRLEGYRLLSHPFALPGARGLPGAGVFNVLVFVLPGGVMVVLADGLRRCLPEHANWLRRIGCALALPAALGWLGQGLWPLDMTALDGAGSRWHVFAWMLWWTATASSALLLALAVPRLRVCGAALMAVLLLPGALPSGGLVLTQPLAAALWAVWMWAGLKALTGSAAICSR